MIFVTLITVDCLMDIEGVMMEFVSGCMGSVSETKMISDIPQYNVIYYCSSTVVHTDLLLLQGQVSQTKTGLSSLHFECGTVESQLLD